MGGCWRVRPNDPALQKTTRLTFPMLDVSTDIVRFIVDRAREFHVKEGVALPDSTDSPGDDLALPRST